MTTIAIGTDIYRRNKQAIEGPTKAQAVRMAEYRRTLLAQARTAEAAGDDETSFDRDCEAFDVEADLIRYGFNPETGKVAK